MNTIPDLDDWQSFWTRLERQYLLVCQALDADPSIITADELSAGIDRLAQEQETAA